ncbi:MAG: ABC transporter ATP-binding protein [Planctomycetota bacterium]
MTLRFDNVSFAYHKSCDVLREIDVECRPGITAIIGPNGAGKSTLLRLACGLNTPRAGNVSLDRTSVTAFSAPQRAQRIAFIPQRSRVAMPFTVQAFVRFGRLRCSSSEGAVARALEAVELDDQRDRPLHELSVGQQQRAGVARAIAQLDGATGSRVLLADEPTSAMDPAHRLMVGEVFQSLANTGVTILLSSHDLNEANALADRVLLLSGDGTVAAHAERERVMEPGVLSRAFGVEMRRLRDQGVEALVPTRNG